MTTDEFWHSNPRKLNIYIKAEKIKEERRDRDRWLMGAYVFDAVSTVVANTLRKKGAESISYRDKPFSASITEPKKNGSNEIVAVFEMKQRTRLLEKSGLNASPS